MKKLFVLLIVFAMSSFAGADLSITFGSEGSGVDVGPGWAMATDQTRWLGIHAEDMPGDGSFEASILIADDPCSQAGGNWTGENNVYMPPALEYSFASYYGYEAGWGDIWDFTNAAAPYPPVQGSDGLHADFEFQSAQEESVVIFELRDDNWELLDTLEIYIQWVPTGPYFWLPEDEFEFTAQAGGADSEEQTLSIHNEGIETLNWEITKACSWLTTDPNSGSVPPMEDDEVTLSVDISGLSPGSYNCQLTISDPCAMNSPQAVQVELHVLARGDFDEDGLVDCDDLRVLSSAWLSESGDDNWNPVCDISDPNDEVIDGRDFGVFAVYWDGCGDPPPPAPGMSYNIETCDPGAMSAAGDKDGLRFSATAGGNYILFEDMMVANCCPEELQLEMTVEGDLITINEIEVLGEYYCLCICDWPVTATLGPFAPGTYTLEVYEDWGGFIGSTIVVIP